MVKKLFLSFFALTVIAIIFSYNTNVHTSTAGAPAGHTGSPADGKSCSTGSGCHGGSPISIAGWIVSNIPSSGYIPGSTYSFTATATQASISKFGFQVSPQSPTGVYQGTLIVTNSTQTQITSTKYITHKSAGTSGSGSKSWAFDWKAPAAGTGNVTFYGAFNATNSNGASSGDVIYTSSLVVTEDVTAGITHSETMLPVIIYPNPASENIRISANLSESANTSISIFDINGKSVKILFDDFTPSGNFARSFDINGMFPAGTYFILLENGNNSLLQKVIIINK